MEEVVKKQMVSLPEVKEILSKADIIKGRHGINGSNSALDT